MKGFEKYINELSDDNKDIYKMMGKAGFGNVNDNNFKDKMTFMIKEYLKMDDTIQKMRKILF